MAKISRKDLEHLSNLEIRRFYIDRSNLPSPIKEYVDGDPGNHGSRISRVGNILSTIIVDRFINNRL